MTIKRKKRLTGPERRRRLIDAAIEIFARKGYENASVEDIASLASVTKPVLYDHFESKEAIFISAIELIRDDLLKRGRDATTRERTPSKRLRSAISAFFDLIEQNPNAARVLIMGSKGATSIVEACRRVQAEATMGIAALMKANSPSRFSHGGIDEEKEQWFLTAEFVKKGMHGLADWWLDHPKIDRHSIEDALFSVLKKGVGLR